MRSILAPSYEIFLWMWEYLCKDIKSCSHVWFHEFDLKNYCFRIRIIVYEIKEIINFLIRRPPIWGFFHTCLMWWIHASVDAMLNSCSYEHDSVLHFNTLFSNYLQDSSMSAASAMVQLVENFVLLWCFLGLSWMKVCRCFGHSLSSSSFSTISIYFKILHMLKTEGFWPHQAPFFSASMQSFRVRIFFICCEEFPGVRISSLYIFILLWQLQTLSLIVSKYICRTN